MNVTETKQLPATRAKFCHIGAPACFALEQACKQIKDAFPELDEADRIGIYVVGSVLERPDWRDVDVRMMMETAADAAYERDTVRHVRGTHAVLEKALHRFLVKKPYDLTDAAYWAWDDLANGGSAGV